MVIVWAVAAIVGLGALGYAAVGLLVIRQIRS